jgi:membrane dipeptidase
MNRRQFLRYSATWGASLALGNLVSSCAQTPVKLALDETLLKGIRIIDAHAHPDQFYAHRPVRIDDTSSLKTIKATRMAASSFAAVGDLVFLSPASLSGSYYRNTTVQLKWVKGLAESGKVTLVLKASDVPNVLEPDFPPGAIMAIEGGDPLDGHPDRVNEFYYLGVRMITLVHYRNNELGDIMRPWPNVNPGPMHNGLTPAGRKVMERMQDLGMLVDVAHAHPITFKQMVEASNKPLVDSHTSLCPLADSSSCQRFRTWQEMELVAKTGGVVCTWPFGYKRSGYIRKTFSDWAREILEMKNRLGMDHVGLGTDGGGNLPYLIDGYRDVRDLVQLVAAMRGVGLSPEDIKAYLGGNFYRVLQSCIG